MDRRKKPVSREAVRKQRDELYAGIERGEITLRDAVRRMRGIARMTQIEFARHRGVSLKVIKEIERGTANPTVATLNQIGDIFGLEVAFVRKDSLKPEPARAETPAIATATDDSGA